MIRDLRVQKLTCTTTAAFLCQVVLLLGASISTDLLLPRDADAQVVPPDRRYLFLEDRTREERAKAKKEEIRRRREALKAQASNVEGLPFDISAGTISYDSTNNTVHAKENLLVGHSLGIIEAEEGEFNISTNEVRLRSDIRITEVATDIVAGEARLNLKSGELDVNDAEVYLEDGGYRLKAERIGRSPEDEYSLDSAILTTCDCPRRESCEPWQLRGDRASIERNGYGRIWDMTLDVEGVPVLYLPYLIFPAKTERQTGLLTPTLGYGRRSGFELQLPFFWAIDYSRDATITPVIETNIRNGVMTEYRQVFSAAHRLEGGLTYLNESQRGQDLLGTNVSDLNDPTFDTNRFAGFLNHNARFSLFNQPLQWVVDGNYVSDDLLLREFEHDRIGRSTSRYVTSQATLRTTFLDRYSVDLSGEYNQAIVSDDDFVFQRAPQFLVQGLDVVRPFGDNPLGAKFVISSTLSSINFLRNESYQGTRTELYEKVKMPFHFRNYFDAALTGDIRASQYRLSDTTIVDFDTGEVKGEFESSTDRAVPGLLFEIDTVLERVYPVGRNNLIKRIADLGVLGRTQEVTRVKHTIQPFVRYRYVPYVDQTDNPQFDTYDRLAKRNVVLYGISQRLYSRHEPRDEYVYGIEEVTPEARDMPSLRTTTPLDDRFLFGVDHGGGAYAPIRRGSVRELAVFTVKQSFNIDAFRDNENGESDEELPELSDVSAGLMLRPNEYIGFHGNTNYDVEDMEVSSYTLEGQFADKRGDELRTRFRFLDNSVSQLETSLQLNVHRRLKLGYYSRYDERESEFLEHRAGIRIVSDCKCWMFDVDVADRLNPDETTFSFTVTLVGLGSFGNSFFELEQEDDDL